jgi:hypothetical protein
MIPHHKLLPLPRNLSSLSMTILIIIGIWLMQIPSNTEIDNGFAATQQLYCDDYVMALRKSVRYFLFIEISVLGFRCNGQGFLLGIQYGHAFDHHELHISERYIPLSRPDVKVGLSSLLFKNICMVGAFVHVSWLCPFSSNKIKTK